MKRGLVAATSAAILLGASFVWKEFRAPAGVTFDEFGRLTSYPGKRTIACPRPDARTAVILAIGQSNIGNFGATRFSTAHGARVVNFFSDACWVAGAPLPAFDGRERWSQRAIRRLAAAADRPPTDEGALSPDGPRLEIGPDWRWFRVGDDPPVSLTRRNSGRRILQHLVGIARDAPATVVTRDELLEIGWPGERMMAESGFARVHTTLWRLRQLGLGEVLVSEEDGYRLRDDVEVVGA